MWLLHLKLRNISRSHDIFSILKNYHSHRYFLHAKCVLCVTTHINAFKCTSHVIIVSTVSTSTCAQCWRPYRTRSYVAVRIAYNHFLGACFSLQICCPGNLQPKLTVYWLSDLVENKINLEIKLVIIIIIAICSMNKTVFCCLVSTMTIDEPK